MAAKAGMHYKTKNRDALVTYLQSREGEHVTVNEIHDHFRKIGNSMGVATIYRQLEKLVAEGQMRKYVVDSGSAACFEYIGARQGHARFIHCKCEKCGKLIHLECSRLDGLLSHICEEHGFSIDPFRTVIYGTCRECAESPAVESQCVQCNAFSSVEEEK